MDRRAGECVNLCIRVCVRHESCLRLFVAHHVMLLLSRTVCRAATEDSVAQIPAAADVVPELPEAMDTDPHPWWVIDSTIRLADGASVNIISPNSAALNGQTAPASASAGNPCGPNNAGVCTAQPRWCYGTNRPNAVPRLCTGTDYCCLASLPPQSAAARFAETSLDTSAASEAESAITLPKAGEKCGAGLAGVCTGNPKWCPADKKQIGMGMCLPGVYCCLAQLPAPVAPAAPVAPVAPVTPKPSAPVVSSGGWYGGASRLPGVAGARFKAGQYSLLADLAHVCEQFSHFPFVPAIFLRG